MVEMRRHSSERHKPRRPLIDHLVPRRGLINPAHHPSTVLPRMNIVSPKKDTRRLKFRIDRYVDDLCSETLSSALKRLRPIYLDRLLLKNSPENKDSESKTDETQMGLEQENESEPRDESGQRYESEQRDESELEQGHGAELEPEPEPEPEPKPLMEIETEVHNLTDMINLINRYREYVNTHQFTIPMDTLIELEPILQQINDLIGMEKVKTQLTEQLLSSLQSLYDPGHRFHTVINGPPGVGKTMLAKLLGQVYLKMGILRSNSTECQFKIATRSDLIGRFLGHTASQTQEFIDSCDGGVLFIDEVYSLGNPEKRDSFSKECIDTLNLNLTEKDNFVCIIAGYPKEIEECFFAYNPGLRRRFNFTYRIDNYTPKQLGQILKLKQMYVGWRIDDDVSDDWLTDLIQENMELFPYFGGDMESWLHCCQTVHGQRVFGKREELKRVLTRLDMTNGLEKYKNNRPFKSEDHIPISARMMYM